MNKEILTAQLELYKKGKEQAAAALEKIKADINAFNGAIEACEHLLRLEGELVAGENTKPPEIEATEILKK